MNELKESNRLTASVRDLKAEHCDRHNQEYLTRCPWCEEEEERCQEFEAAYCTMRMLALALVSMIVFVVVLCVWLIWLALH